MKKVIISILCITYCFTFGTTFSNANTKIIEKYVYAQDWKYNIQWQDDTSNYENDPSTNTSLTELLQTCKNEYISSNIKSQYPYLSWDNFENIKIYESDFKNSEHIAKYLKNTNSIIVNSSMFYNNDYTKKRLCILHELAHCITSSEYSTLSGGFNEPVAELISYSVCESQNINFDFSYKDASMIYIIICNCYGLDKSIHDFYYGTFITNLNSITNNYGNSLASILYFITHTEERKNLEFTYDDLLQMAQDIALHANINTNSSLETCSEFLVITNDYFNNLLSKY